jgi:hypothetical protein
LVEFENDINSEVVRENSKSESNIGFEDEVDSQPDCKILVVEHASRRDPEHRQGVRYKFH